MARSLFDSGRAAGGTPAPERRGDRPLTVTDLSDLIGAALKDQLPPTVRVIGELSGFSDRTHWYFRLKDEQSIVDGVMFASQARRTRFRPSDGMEVIATGRVEHYAKQGRTQLYVQKLDPVGAGELERRYRELCEELRAKGWFEPDRKRAVPAFPGRVAVLTSRTGAALQDVLDTMARRCPAVGVVLVDVRVQGEGAAPEVARALRWVNAQRGALGVDCVLLTRGGGSIEDLWAFNEKALAQAIVRSALPVVAAIGHETDLTIAELVADLRCATPTQAAMRLTPDREALREQLAQLDSSLSSTVRRRINSARELVMQIHRHAHLLTRQQIASDRLTIERLATRLGAARPDAVHARRRAECKSLGARLQVAMQSRVREARRRDPGRALADAGRVAIDSARDRAGALGRELIIASPQSVLARGYSVTTDENGNALRQTKQAKPGARITTRLSDGSFGSIVEAGSGEQAGGGPKPVKLPPRSSGGSRRRRAGLHSDQMDLF